MSRFFFGVVITFLIMVKTQSQPILYLEKHQLKELKKSVQIKDSHHGQAMQSLTHRVNANKLTLYSNNANRYPRSYLAQEAAFLSLMSEKRKDSERYAAKALETIRAIYENPEQERLPHKGYGLSRAMMQLGLALPYAWCRQHWTAKERKFAENKINQALDAWLTYDHANFGNERGSNWVAVCRGGELTLLIAANQQVKRPERYDFLVEQLLLHMQNGYGSLGASQEGMGYIEYGVSFLLKAVYAAASAGDSTLFKEAQKHEWWRLAMYAESFQPFERKFLMTGVAGSGAYNEGFASLLLNQVPESQLPYYTWWYDRHMGTQAPYPAAEKFDNHRAGTIWAIIYYPIDHTSLDPTNVFPIATADDHGYYFFRNRWQDENDILLSLMADCHHHGNAWDQPEVFSLNLMGYNTRFFGGPGKKRENKRYSTLLINDQYNIEKSVRFTGGTDHWQIEQNNANLVVNGGELYRALGTSFAQRHLTVKFFPGNQMLLVLLDTLQADKMNQYTWQANLGDDQGDDSLQVKVLTNKSTSTQIKISGRNQSTLHGWYYQEDTQITNVHDPLQISFKAKDASLISIFWLGKKEEVLLSPTVKKSGIQYKIENETIIYDKKQNEIRIK